MAYRQLILFDCQSTQSSSNSSGVDGAVSTSNMSEQPSLETRSAGNSSSHGVLTVMKVESQMIFHLAPCYLPVADLSPGLAQAKCAVMIIIH